jgi:hypothetical protein
MTGEDGALPCMVMPQAECSDVVTPHLPSQASTGASISNLAVVSAPQAAEAKPLPNESGVVLVEPKDVVATVASDPPPREEKRAELTGELITSDKPVAVVHPLPEIQKTQVETVIQSELVTDSVIGSVKQDSLTESSKTQEPAVAETAPNNPAHSVDVGTNSVEIVSSVVLQTEPVSPVMPQEKAEVAPSKPVTKSSRPPRKKKEEVAMVEIETPEPTVAEKRALSKRPRRGIRIKGAENT